MGARNTSLCDADVNRGYIAQKLSCSHTIGARQTPLPAAFPPTECTGNPAARETRPSALSHAQKSSRGTGARARTGASDGGSRGSELWRGRRRGKIVTAGEQETDAVQADEVAEDIVSMAGRLKESSMAINKTLRTQTRVSVC